MKPTPDTLMNLLGVVLTASIVLAACSDDARDGDVASDYLGSYELMNDEFGTIVTVTVDGSTRTIETNALPDHETGDFPNQGNPNTISDQDLVWEFPVEAVFTGAAEEPRVPGVAVDQSFTWTSSTTTSMPTTTVNRPGTSRKRATTSISIKEIDSYGRMASDECGTSIC